MSTCHRAGTFNPNATPPWNRRQAFCAGQSINGGRNYSCTVNEEKRRASKCYRKLIKPLREVARSHGYALAVHGSIARDVDLVAVQWVGNASDQRTLARAIQAKAQDLNGVAFMHPNERDDEYFKAGCPGESHMGGSLGRLCSAERTLISQ